MAIFKMKDENGVFVKLLTEVDEAEIDAAIDLKQNITDNTLATTSKTVPGAINELKGMIEGGGSIPSGGTTGQVLKKKSDTDRDVEWGDVSDLTLENFDDDVIDTSTATAISDSDDKIATSKIIKRELDLKQNVTDNSLSTTDKTIVGAINELDTDIGNIQGVISDQATSTNKLVSASEMGDAISSVEAKQIYKTADQGSFATKAELLAATTFYNADGTEATPTKNDVAYVLADESHDGNLAKYTIASISGTTITWGFVIAISSMTFTQAQLNAINSTITESKVTAYDEHITDTENPHSVTKDQVGLGDVVNTGDSATPVEGGTTKFTTGGAYTELAKKVDKVAGKDLSTNDFTDEYQSKIDDLVVYSASQPTSEYTKFWVQID